MGNVRIIDANAGVATSSDMLATLSAGYGPRDFAVRFWDGTTLAPDPGQPARFTLVLQHAGALRAMFWPFNDKGFGEAYIFNDFDVEGDIHAFFGWVHCLIERGWGTLKNLRFLYRLMRLPNTPQPRIGGPAGAALSGPKRSLERDRAAIEFSYNTSNEFYKLFLDRNMLYTCAYFHSPDEPLDTAQERKIDLICRKLRLKPGEKLLDIGCGWGGLLVHAVKHYGVEGVGVTLSREMVAYSRERIKAEGLEGRCRVEYQDYREVPKTGEYDKVSCIGLAEHIGEQMMTELMKAAWGALKPRGHYLHHGITLRANTPYPKWTAFARRYVFPDGELRPIVSALKAGESVGFEIRDVESLREHYVLTLENWVKNLESHREAAVKLTDDVTYRIFRIYLAGAARGYRTGLYNLYQTLFVKPETTGVTGLPLTREAWYGGPRDG
ncbi:MAG: cyclopropane-fatty-acyl-phospholipid synthase family protein [Gemmataceae bacterium]|nr:cyclopropane-fatty-acyl-phospholipid synthase family protein [Gemmataceae bacterium]